MANKTKFRIFIVAPSGQNDEDCLHHVCKTHSKKGLLDIYGMDKYDVVSTVTSLKMAINKAKKLGAKRPTVI